MSKTNNLNQPACSILNFYEVRKLELAKIEQGINKRAGICLLAFTGCFIASIITLFATHFGGVQVVCFIITLISFFITQSSFEGQRAWILIESEEVERKLKNVIKSK